MVYTLEEMIERLENGFLQTFCENWPDDINDDAVHIVHCMAESIAPEIINLQTQIDELKKLIYTRT